MVLISLLSACSCWERLQSRRFKCLLTQGSESPSLRGIPLSQDSNSLSLLTEMSGVEAPVPLRSFSVLQSLASGLPRWRGEAGNKWGWWRRSGWEPSGEPSVGRREGSCCSLGGGKSERDKSDIPCRHTGQEHPAGSKLMHYSCFELSVGLWVFLYIPILCRCSAVSLTAVLEPVADLCGCESCGLG